MTADGSASSAVRQPTAPSGSLTSSDPTHRPDGVGCADTDTGVLAHWRPSVRSSSGTHDGERSSTKDRQPSVISAPPMLASIAIRSWWP